MGLLTQMRTTRLLRTNYPLGQENARFTSFLREAFIGTPATAALSNYVHTEDQNFNRADMFAVISEVFEMAWEQALLVYENFPEGDSAAHGRFLALSSKRPPYERYDLHELLLSQHRKEIVDRMIYLVRTSR